MASALLRRSVTMAMNGCLRQRSDRLILANAAMFRRGLADESGMPLTFASPYEAHYDGVRVRQVDVPSFSGSFGILPNHVPALAVLKPGVVTVFENDGSAKKFFVSSGTVTINEDSSVQILAEEAVPVDSLDRSAAERNLTAAQSALTSASTEQGKAEAQILIEVNEAIVKSAE
jgi:F-type H+-transporting ATPase subunit delta